MSIRHRIKIPKVTRKFAAAMAVSVWMISGALPAQSATCPAGKVVEKAGSAIIKAAQANSAPEFSSALTNYADMQAIAMFALGKHRKQLSDDRRSRFVSLTTNYISQTLQDYRKKFQADSITVVDCRGKVVHAKLILLGGQPAQPVLWRMSGSKIVDVNIQNVWLGQQLRSNFDQLIRNGQNGIDGLFEHLQTK